MQDAGLPHIGCRCARCRSGRVEHAACLGVVDPRREPAGVWLIDATPDIGAQLALLAEWLGPHPGRPERLRQPDGIFLTHAHMGHTAGLTQLGPEGLFARDLPVFGREPLLTALAAMPLWRPLLGNLRPTALADGEPFALGPDLSVTAVPVPHRDEIGAGTLAYLVTGPTRTLLYAPDIDDWSLWEEAGRWLARADVVLADASFYGPDELGGRPPVAHPLVPDTLAFFRDFPGRLVLTHLNHTNPLLDPDGPAHRAVAAAGAEVATAGRRFTV